MFIKNFFHFYEIRLINISALYSNCILLNFIAKVGFFLAVFVFLHKSLRAMVAILEEKEQYENKILHTKHMKMNLKSYLSAETIWNPLVI